MTGCRLAALNNAHVLGMGINRVQRDRYPPVSTVAGTLFVHVIVPCSSIGHTVQRVYLECRYTLVGAESHKFTNPRDRR